MKTPSKIPALQSLASSVIGDGKSPNLYFVTDNGVTVTVTRNREIAISEWRALAARRPLVESALEDRKTGVLASVAPLSDAPSSPLVVEDSL